MGDAKRNVAVIIGCIVIGALIGGFSVYSAMSGSSRRSAAIVADMEAENSRLAEKIGEVENAISTVGERLAGATIRAGSIADNIESVVDEIDTLPKILGELIAFFDSIEKITRDGIR